MKLAILQAAAPLARLIGHSLAAAVGFCALAAISLIPIQVVKLLTLLGFSQIARPLRVLEQTLLFADICLFAITFVSGVAVFAAETIDAARRRISKILGANDHDR